MGGYLALGLLAGACTNGTTMPGSDAATDAAARADATDSAAVPTTASIALDGDPNGLYWNATSNTLYIADNANNRILTYTDAAGVSTYADLPAASASGPGLGQLIPLSADGSLLVTRFGFGTNGDVVHVATDTTSSILPGLDPTRERIGLAQASDGTLYDTYFVQNGTGYIGSVASLTLSGTETAVVNGLQKPVGVLIAGGAFYIDDQDTNALYTTSVTAPGTLSQVALLPDADLLCEGANGTIFSGGADGNVRAIDSSGNVTIFASGFTKARGVAYDGLNHRLFIANHVGATSSSNTIEIRPVP
jgi:sugar lactone lactonase YvrE